MSPTATFEATDVVAEAVDDEANIVETLEVLWENAKTKNFIVLEPPARHTVLINHDVARGLHEINTFWTLYSVSCQYDVPAIVAMYASTTRPTLETTKLMVAPYLHVSNAQGRVCQHNHDKHPNKTVQQLAHEAVAWWWGAPFRYDIGACYYLGKDLGIEGATVNYSAEAVRAFLKLGEIPHERLLAGSWKHLHAQAKGATVANLMNWRYTY